MAVNNIPTINDIIPIPVISKYDKQYSSIISLLRYIYT
jgi:hypothetical protein